MESDIQQLIQIDGVQYGVQLMRNNSGALKDTTGRWVRFGLGNVSKKHSDEVKSSDLIGFTKVTITPHHVGKTFAVFTAVEVKDYPINQKDENKLDATERAQLNFIRWVRLSGGFSGFASSLQEFRKIIGL